MKSYHLTFKAIKNRLELKKILFKNRIGTDLNPRLAICVHEFNVQTGVG